MQILLLLLLLLSSSSSIILSPSNHQKDKNSRSEELSISSKQYQYQQQQREILLSSSEEELSCIEEKTSLKKKNDEIVMSSSKMMKIAFCDGTGTSSILFRDGTVPVPKSHEILIQVKASGLNRIDTYMSKGAFGKVDVLGMEVSGVVIGAGSEAKMYKDGTRVMALLKDGGHAQYIVVDERHAMPIPQSMSFNEAAAIPEQWLTAFQLLFLVGEMKKGDNVLIHAGGSGVGTAAVQLVKVMGGTPFVTAGAKHKIEKAIQLGAKAGWNYKTEDWGTAMEGKANVILDCVGGTHASRNAQALAMDSRWVLFGLMGGRDAPGEGKGLLGTLLRKRASIRGTTLRTRSHEYKEQLTKRFASEVLPLFVSKKLKVEIDSEFKWTDVADAYDHLIANKNVGKILLVDVNE